MRALRTGCTEGERVNAVVVVRDADMAVFAIDNIDEGEEVCIWYGTDWAPTAADEEGASPGPKARDYATMADRERWAAQNDLGVARLRALGCMRETWMEQLEQIEALEAPGLLAEPSGVLPRSRNKRKGQLQAHSATDANTAKKSKPQAGDRRKDQEGAGSLEQVQAQTTQAQHQKKRRSKHVVQWSTEVPGRTGGTSAEDEPEQVSGYRMVTGHLDSGDCGYRMVTDELS